MFDRLELLIGNENLNKLKNTHVLVLGLGGVGGYAVESLVRSGIGEITIVDSDTIDITNINRQIIATSENIGKYKTEEFKKRIYSIRKDIKVHTITKFIEENNIDLIVNNNIDFIIDACDSIKTKQVLIKKCLDLDISFITCTGTGNRLNPSALKITYLNKTSGDPVAKILRKYIRDNNINANIPCVCSTEVPKRKGKVISSNSFVPPSAGLLLASYVINKIIKEDL